jgi:hypothetical protein
LMISLILRVPDLARTEVLAGTELLAETVVFSAIGVFRAGYSSAAGVAWPAEVGAGSVRISGTSGALPLSMPALLSPAPASSAVSGHLVELLCPCGHQKPMDPVEPPSPCGCRGQSCLAPVEGHPSPGKWFCWAQAKMPAPETWCDLQRVCRGWQWPPTFQCWGWYLSWKHVSAQEEP